MRIVVSGTAGSGKTSVAKEIAARLNYKHYSIGDFFGKIALKKGVDLIKLSKLAESDPSIDKEADEMQKALNKEDDFVIDSRLGAFFIPDSIKIFLDADLKTRAKRIIGDERVDEQNKSIKGAIKGIKKREESENKRYKKYYGYDCYDKSKFDLVIDTTDIDIEGVVDKIMVFIKREGTK